MWNQHPEVGEEITLDTFGRLPYLGHTCGERASALEAELDAAGVKFRQEVSSDSFVVSPLLQRGTCLLARELRGRNITVNAVAPGPAAGPPVGQLGTPGDIAELVAFLAGPGRWVTGQVIYANGGLA